jgi:hypothetical protein
MKRTFTVAALAAVVCTQALAIVNGTDAPEFTWVGQVNGASGVVVAPNWVLTATHVGVGPFNYNGTNFTPDQVINADGLAGRPLTDLTLMHFSNSFATWSDPYYGSSVGQIVTIVGFGEGGVVRPDGTGLVVTQGTGVRRKGVNVASRIQNEILPWVSATVPVSTIEFDLDGNGIDRFGDGGPLLNNGANIEASYGVLDSGGGMFLNVSGAWRLVGTNDFRIDFNGNSNELDFGDGGGAVNLAAYQNWIEATIHPVPEPATMIALSAGIAGLLARRRRAR